MVDDGGDAEEGGRASQVLQVPEQEGKHQSNSKAAKPENEEHGGVLDGSEHLEHADPVGQSASPASWHEGHGVGFHR